MIDFIVVAISIMLSRLLADSDGHFLQLEEFEDVENPDFENIKHMQNLGHFLLNKSCRWPQKEYPNEPGNIHI